jgi:hypothetical protein
LAVFALNKRNREFESISLHQPVVQNHGDRSA